MDDAKCAVVTGASRGIGKAIAAALCAAGYDVVGTATSDTGVKSIEDALCSEYPRSSAMVLDVTSDVSIDKFISTLLDAGHQPHVLVNNAAITRDNLVLRMKDDEWDEVLSANLTSVFKLSRRLIRIMIKARAGRIINIGSVVGSIGNAGQTNYAAAKAGMVGYTKSLAREIASRGITVNAIAPGFIDTDMTKDLAPVHREQMLSQIPVGRLGLPEEIAAAVVFLASDTASYITGETLHVNGGMYMS
ncbi:MAG: 3-oxoacyl-[acyl-carrier protein] reductase [Gammaproteobacteria bacterium]|jgi:3-oxoacyl-[acyl-carrier protein] reductase